MLTIDVKVISVRSLSLPIDVANLFSKPPSKKIINIWNRPTADKHFKFADRFFFYWGLEYPTPAQRHPCIDVLETDKSFTYFVSARSNSSECTLSYSDIVCVPQLFYNIEDRVCMQSFSNVKRELSINNIIATIDYFIVL